jgi:hypothetical protein
MPQTIKIKSVFDIEKFRAFHDDMNPLTKHERELLILTRAGEQLKVYERFDNDFNLFLSKLQNSPAKKAAEKLYNNKVIYLGTNTKQDGCLGSPLIGGDGILGGVILDSADFDISLSNGDTSNIDLCIYGTYFNYIRGIVLSNRKEIKKDIELHELLITYLKNLIKKNSGIPQLNEKQDLLYDLVVRVFFYQFFLYYDFDMAFDLYIKKKIPEQFKSEFNILLRNIDKSKYVQFRDIFKILFDLKITSDNPNTLLSSTLQKLGISQFLYISSVIDYLIAATILSLYPGSTFTKNLFINRVTQEAIESKITHYSNSIRFDFDMVSRI